MFYIDYGNTEPVEDLLAVLPLDKSFFASPTYCIGVSTSIRFTCPDPAPLVDLLAPVVFNATLERRADAWFAALKCEKTDKSLSEFATEHEFAFEPTETDVEPPYVAFGEWPLNDEKRVTVAHVDSPNKFYLQLTKDTEKIAAMQQRLQLAVRGLLPVVGPVNGLCAARKSDGQWCRAEARGSTAAFAVDFGETMTSTVTKKLPLSFAEDPSRYIVECSLNVKPVEGGWTDAAVERFTSLVASGRDVSAKLEFAKSPKIVDLVVDGVSVGATLVAAGLAQWQCHAVIVSHANSLSDFYIQEPERENDLFELAEQLKEAASWESVEPAVDDLVVAQFDEDELWYRAAVVKIEDDERRVRFVDYGNESACAQFRALPESLRSTPYLATKCTLHNLPENADELNAKFVDLVTAAEGAFTAYYLSREEPMLVLLYYDDADLEVALRESPEASEAPAVTAQVAFENVAVCQINSPSSFYVQAETAPLDSVATALVDVEKGAPAQASVGDVVAALFPDDGVWYRARIADVADGAVNVLFVDYGNRCDVTELRQLPESVRGVPALAKHCAFTLPAGLDQWPDIAKQRFSELTCEGNAVFKLNLLEEGDPAYVDLQDEGVNVADELATLCKADLTTTRRPSESLVVLSHVESLTEIWIQFQTPQLDEMADEMANADTFEAIDTVEEGSLVAALFEDDGNWYRAKVIKVEDATYDVLFIDYGNRSTTSNIKSLPADLVILPALAKCCQLKDFVEVAEGHVDAVVAKLKESVDAAQTFTLRELVDGDVNFVSLGCDDEQDLTSAMMAFYNKLVHSTMPAGAQFADAAETPEDAVESAEFGDVESEGVAESEKIVSSASEEIAQSTQQEDAAAVVDNSCGVTEEKTDIEQVAEQVESRVESQTEPSENAENESGPEEKAVEPIVSGDTDEEPVEEELVPNAAVDGISEKKESVPCHNGEQEAVPDVEKETPTSQSAEEAHPCLNFEDSVPSQKVKKATEEIREIANSVSAAGMI